MKNKLIVMSLLVGITMPSTAQNTLILTLPKTGTNLVLKLVKEITQEDTFTHLIALLKRNLYWSHSWVHLSEKNDALEPTEEKIEKLKQRNTKLILLLRDPRQHIIALLRTANKPINSSTIQWAIYHFPEMMNMITGSKTFLPSKAINDCYYTYLKWASHYPDVYVTSFEKLVGPKGGGNSDIQRNEIEKIATFLGVHLSNEDIESIASRLFGGTPTFKEGKIDSWRHYYSDNDKASFKKVAGQLLIDLGYEKNFDW